MPVRYSTPGWITGCGIDLEHPGEADRAVEDLNQVDCESCLEDVERSRIWHILAQEPSYQVGYEDGKGKAFFEMANWRPADLVTMGQARGHRLLRGHGLQT